MTKSGVRKDWPILRDIFDKVLSSVSLEKEMEIINKWTGIVDKTKDLIELTNEETMWLNKHPTIRISGDPDWLPQEAFTETGEYIGIVPDILKKVEEKLPLTFEIVPSRTWTNTLEMARIKKIDVISAIENEERKKYLKFTTKYLNLPVVIITPRGYESISNPSSLKGKKVGIPKNYGFVKELKEKYPKQNFLEVETVTEGLTKVCRALS